MAEKKVIELEVKTESFKPLKAQLREAQAAVAELSEKFGATSQEAINAAKRASELKDAIADAKDLTDAFNPDAKFNALSNSIGGALNGFQAFEGALGLVGVESEQLQATLLKVQSAMALSQGLQGLMEAKDSFKQLGAVAMDALKGIRTGLLLTGIGAFVVILGTVVAYWDDIKKAVGGVTEEEKKLADFRRKHEQERRDFVANESKDFASSLAQLKATNKGSKERSELITEINQKYGTTLKNLSDEAAFQNQVNQELENYLKYQTAKFKLQANEDAIVQNLKTQSRLRQEIAQSEKDLAKAIQEGAGKTKRTLEDGVLTTVDVNEKASIAAEQAAKKIRENEKALADAEKRFENYGKAALKAGDDIAKLTNNGKKYVEQNKEVVTKTKETTDVIIEETRKQGEITQEQADFFTQMLIDSEAEKQKIRDEAKAKQEEEELMLMQFKGDLYKQDVDNFDAAEAKKKKLREDNLKSSVKAGIDALNLIASIAEMNAGEDVARQKKAFGIRKAANIASATIDGYKAVLSTYADTPGGPVIKGIAAAIAGAFAALQIASIAKQEFNSAGGSPSPTPSPSPSGGAGGSVITPNFNIVGNAQATNPLAGLGNQPLQAYVVSGEVTTAQNLDRNRINYATFG
jgi:hypothetical protein